jgi:hypothetical protein
VAHNRENLIRENFEHERNFHYLKFREYHWNMPEIVKACPDPLLREKMLKDYWNQDAEKRYPEYRAAVAGMSMAELLTEREDWIEKLDILGMLADQKKQADAARHPANDNVRGVDR